METSFKNWLCPNFLSLPKKSELPKLWGGCSLPRPPGPYAYDRDRFILPLLLPTPTIWFSIGHRKRSRKKWKRSNSSDADSSAFITPLTTKNLHARLSKQQNQTIYSKNVAVGRGGAEKPASLLKKRLLRCQTKGGEILLRG